MLTTTPTGRRIQVFKPADPYIRLRLLLLLIWPSECLRQLMSREDPPAAAYINNFRYMSVLHGPAYCTFLKPQGLLHRPCSLYDVFGRICLVIPRRELVSNHKYYTCLLLVHPDFYRLGKRDNHLPKPIKLPNRVSYKNESRSWCTTYTPGALAFRRIVNTSSKLAMERSTHAPASS